MANDLVVQNARTVATLIESNKAGILAALPKQAGLEVEQFIRIGLTTLKTNPKLLECTPESIISGMLRAAQDGFSLDPNMCQAYLVPFRNNKTGRMEAQYIRGYRGLISLMTRFGEVKFVTAHIVYESDTFDIEYGQNERLVHKPYVGEPEGRGEEVGAYAVAHFKDGTSMFIWMGIDEIEKIRKASKTYSRKDNRNFGPWNDWKEAMIRKCPVRQLHKYLPIKPALMVYHNAAAEDEAQELGYSNIDLLPEPETGNITDALAPGIPEPDENEEKEQNKPKKEKKPKAEQQELAPSSDPNFETIEDVCGAISKIDNPVHLKNWWNKHKAFIETAFATDLGVIKEAKENREKIIA